jgi:hypothetical protein
MGSELPRSRNILQDIDILDEKYLYSSVYNGWRMEDVWLDK